MPTLTRIGSAAVLAAVVIAGCGGGKTASNGTAPSTSNAVASPASQPAAGGGSGDPCQLVTSADATAAIGGPVGPAKAITSKSGAHSCTYTEQPAAVDAGLVTVTVLTKDVTFAALKSQYTDLQPLPGTGDEAFLAVKAETAGGNAVVRKGSTLVAISLGAKGPTTAIPGKLAALAKAAAGQM